MEESTPSQSLGKKGAGARTGLIMVAERLTEPWKTIIPKFSAMLCISKVIHQLIDFILHLMRGKNVLSRAGMWIPLFSIL